MTDINAVAQLEAKDEEIAQLRRERDALRALLHRSSRAMFELGCAVMGNNRTEAYIAMRLCNTIMREIDDENIDAALADGGK